MKESYFIEKNYHVVFSEHDEEQTGKGWYIQNCKIKGWPSSKLFKTESQLLENFKNGKLIYSHD